jgi:hypothetical protein
VQAGRSNEVWGREGVKRVWCVHQLASSADRFLVLGWLYLELRYLSKGRSEFGKNNILIKVYCNVFQWI